MSTESCFGALVIGAFIIESCSFQESDGYTSWVAISMKGLLKLFCHLYIYVPPGTNEGVSGSIKKIFLRL